MGVYQVDVWFCTEDDRPIKKADWRRYVVAADDGTEAMLVACQMAYRYGHVADAVMVDWPGL